MTSTTLAQGWTLTLRSGHGPDGTPVAIPDTIPDEIPTSVPGCVHTDLLAHGLIPDPYLDRNEELVQWIGEADACYRTVVDLVDQGHERVDLVADGIDTVSTVSVNGTVVGTTRNQHRSHRFDLRSVVRPVANEVKVEIDAPLRAARESEQRIGAKPLVDDALPYNALRKMACNFGWDWGPTLTTSGICKPMRIHRWSTARLARVVPTVTVDPDGRGRVEIAVELERTSDHEVDVDVDLVAPDGVSLRASTVTTTTSAAIGLTVDHPELWWPRGHGAQPLYQLTVRARRSGADDREDELDLWTHAIGFRTVRLRMELDDDGTCFEFHVNGERLWVRGANWIPADCFPSRLDRADYERGVRDAVEADMNMLRVWGGGLYESDDFYDLCNREGILVWQDFLFACAAYSEAEELWMEVEAEARENVGRLAANPALVIWNGSNENIEGYYHWGFQERMPEGAAWGRGYYDELLPRVLREIDPTRAYIPSSPYSPNDYSDPRDPDHGPVHSWKVWFSEDYLTYRDVIPRFVAEFGFQGAPTWATLTRAVHDDPLTPDSPGMLSHQKAIDGQGKLSRGWAPHLPDPTSIDDWHFTTTLNQARAITCAVSHFRSRAPRNGGYLVWQLNDCWPAVSWAMVDGDGRRKPLWYALRALNAPRVLLLQPREDGVALVVSNDSPQRWIDSVHVRRLGLDGHQLDAQEIPTEVPARTTATFLLPPHLATPNDPTTEMVVADATTVPGLRRAWWWFVEDVALALPEPVLEAVVTRTPSGVDVRLTAQTLVKDLVLSPDRLDPDAVASDQLVTLLPGETSTISVTTSAELDPVALTTHPVLNSAGHLCHARTSAQARR